MATTALVFGLVAAPASAQRLAGGTVAAPSCRSLATMPDDAATPAGEPGPDVSTVDAEARARYLRGDLDGALDALNRRRAPAIRCVNVEGLVRTDPAAIIEYLGTRSGEVLTAETLARLNRRLGELTFASRTPARFDPEPGGTTTITPIVTERNVLPAGMFGWGDVVLRALFMQDIRVRVVSPSGRGEVWTPSYRWSSNRPRAMLRYDAPAPGQLPGLIGVLALAEKQTYRHPALGPDRFSEARYRIGGSLADWVTSWLRWEGGAAFDRIGTASRLALEGSLNARAFADRLALIASGGRWLGADAARSFSSGELLATARSTAEADVPVFLGVVGVAAVGERAALAVWPAASTSEGRGAFLRAHPLRRDSVINGEAFGRTLVFSTAEYEHPIQTPVGALALVGFVDGARASRRLDGSSSPFHVDIGTGVRINALGAGALRFEVGYGLRDRRLRASAGYVATWGIR